MFPNNFFLKKLIFSETWFLHLSEEDEVEVIEEVEVGAASAAEVNAEGERDRGRGGGRRRVEEVQVLVQTEGDTEVQVEGMMYKELLTERETEVRHATYRAENHLLDYLRTIMVITLLYNYMSYIRWSNL